MELDLVHSGCDVGYTGQFFQVADLEVAHADGTGTSLFIEGLQFFPGAQVTAGDGPVDQVQIHIVGHQALQAPGKRTLHIAQTLGVVPDLGGDEQVRARDLASLDAPAHAVLVFISGSGVDEPVAGLHRPVDRAFDFPFAGCFIYAEPQEWHLGSRIQSDCVC